MNNRIERTLFWFKNGREECHRLTNYFFALGTLLNRLLNEKYHGKKIQFINIEFFSLDTYQIFPIIPPNYIHYYGKAGGHLAWFN